MKGDEWNSDRERQQRVLDRVTDERQEPFCPCGCRPGGQSCGETLRGIELTYGECILCNEGDHWEDGDDDAAFDWPAIFAAAEAPVTDPILIRSRLRGTP